jgi:hypothetical protein
MWLDEVLWLPMLSEVFGMSFDHFLKDRSPRTLRRPIRYPSLRAFQVYVAHPLKGLPRHKTGPGPFRSKHVTDFSVPVDYVGDGSMIMFGS